MIARLIRHISAASVSAIVYRYVIYSITENPVYSIRGYFRRQARTYLKPSIIRTDAQQIFSDGMPVPCGSSRQPAVLSLPGAECILARHHLAIDVRLDLVQFLVTYECRRNFAIMLPCILTPPAKSLSYHNPRIVVAEYASILLISLRI